MVKIDICDCSLEEVGELFLLKYNGEISRSQINDDLRLFRRFNVSNTLTSELSENEALMAFEERGEPMTARRLRSLVDVAAVVHVNYLQFLCILYSKSIDEVTVFRDEDARIVALAKAQRAKEHADKVKSEIKAALEARQHEAKRKAVQQESLTQMVNIITYLV